MNTKHLWISVYILSYFLFCSSKTFCHSENTTPDESASSNVFRLMDLPADCLEKIIAYMELSSLYQLIDHTLDESRLLSQDFLLSMSHLDKEFNKWQRETLKPESKKHLKDLKISYQKFILSEFHISDNFTSFIINLIDILKQNSVWKNKIIYSNKLPDFLSRQSKLQSLIEYLQYIYQLKKDLLSTCLKQENSEILERKKRDAETFYHILTQHKNNNFECGIDHFQSVHVGIFLEENGSFQNIPTLVQQITISGHILNSDSLSHISNFNTLQHLDLADNDLDDWSVLIYFPKSIKTLNLSGCASKYGTTLCPHLLHDFQELTELNLSRIPLDRWECLQDLPENIRKLDLSHADFLDYSDSIITENNIKSLQHLQSLEDIKLNNIQLNNWCFIQYLSPSIKKLNLSSSNILPETLSYLSKITYLREVLLNYIDLDHWENISDLPQNILTIELTGSNISSNALKKFKKFTNLEQLNLTEVYLDNIDFIHQLPIGIKKLSLDSRLIPLKDLINQSYIRRNETDHCLSFIDINDNDG